MSDYQKPMFSEDDERRPLMTEEELRDACLHDAATIVVAVELGCEFEDCRLTDDGYKWPTSISSVDLKYPKSWRGAEAATKPAGRAKSLLKNDEGTAMTSASAIPPDDANVN